MHISRSMGLCAFGGFPGSIITLVLGSLVKEDGSLLRSNTQVRDRCVLINLNTATQFLIFPCYRGFEVYKPIIQ